MKVLYLSYDGMTDPLGQSQVIPYLAGLVEFGHSFTLLSCEKPDRYSQHKDSIQQLLKKHQIDWQPIIYTKKPPVISTIWDIYKMRKKAFGLHSLNHYDTVHCRSYISALVGLEMKQKFKTKFIFDMRGFWADERVDGGLWNLDNFLYKKVYNYFKNKEIEFIEQADGIISLTEAGKKEMLNWAVLKKHPKGITVIPCCADFQLFTIPTNEIKQKARKELGIEDNNLVINYLGSIGTWYLLKEMLLFFKQLLLTYPNAKFLFITPDNQEHIKQEAHKIGILNTSIITTSATRNEVAFKTSASDLSIFFIKPSYSKLSSSPTKLGELLAMGIPTICNSGVGDVASVIQATGGGFALNKLDSNHFEEAITQIPNLLQANKQIIREKAFVFNDLQAGVNTYNQLYQRITK